MELQLGEGARKERSGKQVHFYVILGRLTSIRLPEIGVNDRTTRAERKEKVHFSQFHFGTEMVALEYVNGSGRSVGWRSFLEILRLRRAIS